MKKCFKCGKIKQIDEFYKHPEMKDGRFGKCKDCAKADSTKNRNDKIEKYRAYDTKRGNRQSLEYHKKHNAEFPNKYRATNMVYNAIRDGKLFREPCSICGKTEHIHAHHDDYAKPLNVRWLCPVHHSEWHKLNGKGKNRK